jgi:hypothetical protein
MRDDRGQEFAFCGAAPKTTQREKEKTMVRSEKNATSSLE